MSTAILVTGAAGFIGFHLCRRLLAMGKQVVGVDNLNDYYDVELKRARLAQLEGQAGFRFVRLDVADREGILALWREVKPRRVVHLAAQAGVRHSIRFPHTYVTSNLVGFANILEACHAVEAGHLIYASSSSVYGASVKVPSSVDDQVDHPISLYAATKKANELMAHAYSHLHRLPTTGLRFFTAYGPWGRPDMAYFSFTKAIVEGRPIDLFDEGKLRRDFTYIDDIIEAIVRLIDHVPAPQAATGSDVPPAPYRIYNIGNNAPVEVRHLVRVIENCLGLKAVTRSLPMQPGDVPSTCADAQALTDAVGFKPSTSIEEGLARFVEWYRAYYR